MEIKNVVYCFHLVLLVICSALDLSDDLRQLSEMLPGYYRYSSQHSRHVPHGSERPLSPDQTPAEALTTIPLRATYQPVDLMFAKDSFNVYVEQTVQGKTRPHRRWLYSFSKDETSRAIKLRVYNFKVDSSAEKVAKNMGLLKYLTEDDFTTSNNCDMLWRRLGERFVGTTSRLCIAVVNGKEVIISVMMTLTQSSLQIDEGWYNAQDGTKVIELDGPIFMTKEGSITVENTYKAERPSDKKISKSLLQSDSQRVAHSPRHSGHLRNQIPEHSPARHEVKKSNTYHTIKAVDRNDFVGGGNKGVYKNVVESLMNRLPQGKLSGNDLDAKVRSPSGNIFDIKNKDKSMWTLQSYDGVIDALESGHKVYFSAKTKKCFHSGAKKREKTFFGDYVDTYEIQKDFTAKQPNRFLQFSLRRTQHTKKGFQDVIKQVTAHRNGTVHIISVNLNEDGKIIKNFFTECALFDQDRRKGDVKFYLDPYRDVAEVTKAKSLHTALQNGNMVRITTEIDKCSGGYSDHVIIGGEFRGYDMGRNGKTVDVNLKSTKLVQKAYGDLSVEEHYLIFQFPSRGEITVYRRRKHATSLLQNVSIVNGYQRYVCDMDSNSSTKSISVYIT